MIDFNWVVFLIDVLIGLSILLYIATHKTSNELGFSFRVGLWVGAIGLLGQAYRNGVFLFVGNSPSDNEVPIWVMKDVGLWIVGISFLVANSRRKKGKNK